MAQADDIQAAELILEELDNLISEHVINSQNRVETGWEMRGFLDYLTGTIDSDDKNDENYGSDYRDGLRAARAYMESR